MVLRNPGRRVRQRFDALNRTNFFVFLAGLILLAVIVVPRVVPQGQRGPACTDLAAPIGGNNRSALSYTDTDGQRLGLQVEVTDPVSAGQGMNVIVTFINGSARRSSTCPRSRRC